MNKNEETPWYWIPGLSPKQMGELIRYRGAWSNFWVAGITPRVLAACQLALKTREEV
jgi:hypothetical protein